MIRAAMVAGVSLLSPFAFAQEAVGTTGNQIWSMCNPVYPDRSQTCAAYVIGAFEGMRLGYDIARHQFTGPDASGADISELIDIGLNACIPDGVTNGQIVDVVVAYLSSHPAERHIPATFILADSLTDAFSCE